MKYVRRIALQDDAAFLSCCVASIYTASIRSNFTNIARVTLKTGQKCTFAQLEDS